MNFLRRHSDLLWLTLIVLLAAALRFYKLDSLSPGLWFDEGWSAVAARNSADAGIYPLYYAANFGGMHPAIVYLARLGNLFSGGHPLTIRYALAAVGTLTVALSYSAYRAIWRLDGTLISQMNSDKKSEANQCSSFDHAQDKSVFIRVQKNNPLFSAFVLVIVFPYLLFTRMGCQFDCVLGVGGGLTARAMPPLSLPSTSSGGDNGYVIALGWYTWPTYERLSLGSDNLLENGRYLLKQ